MVEEWKQKRDYSRFESEGKSGGRKMEVGPFLEAWL